MRSRTQCGARHRVNVKKLYGDQARSIFIMPPSVEELRRRLEGRATDSAEVINERVGKAEFEIGFAKDYDFQVVNDDLATAIAETEALISEFVKG